MAERLLGQHEPPWRSRLPEAERKRLAQVACDAYFAEEDLVDGSAHQELWMRVVDGVVAETENGITFGDGDDG